MKKKPPQEASPSQKGSLPKPLWGRGCLPHNVFTQIQSSKLWLLFDCWSNNDSNKHVSLHANYPLSIVRPCVEKDIPSFGGAWGGFFFTCPLITHYFDEIGVFWRLEASEREEITPMNLLIFTRFSISSWTETRIFLFLKKMYFIPQI